MGIGYCEFHGGGGFVKRAGGFLFSGGWLGAGVYWGSGFPFLGGFATVVVKRGWFFNGRGCCFCVLPPFLGDEDAFVC